MSDVGNDEDEEQSPDVAHILHLMQTRMTKMKALSLGAELRIAGDRGKNIYARTLTDLMRFSGRSLQRLDLSGCVQLQMDSLLIVAQGCPSLKALTVNGCKDIFTSPDLIWTAAEGRVMNPMMDRHSVLNTISYLFSGLEELSFELVEITLETFLAFVASLKSLNSLALGRISDNINVEVNNSNNNHITAQLEPFLRLQHLRAVSPPRFSLAQNGYHETVITELVSLLASHNPAGLRKLRLLVPRLEPVLIEVISKFESLEVLGISALSVVAPFLALEAKALRKFVYKAPRYPNNLDPKTLLSALVQEDGIFFPSKSTLKVLKIPTCDQELFGFIATQMPRLTTLVTQATGTWRCSEGTTSIDDHHRDLSTDADNLPCSVNPIEAFFELCSRDLKCFSWRGWVRPMNNAALLACANNLGHSLRTLSLRDSPDVTDVGLLHLSKSLVRLTSLELEDLSHRGVKGTTLQFVSLTSLRLTRCKGIRDETLATIVHHHPLLTDLVLYQVKAGKRTCVAIGQLTSLARLELWSFRARLNNAALEELGSCTSLRSLQLTSMPLIDMAGITAMVSRGCASLKALFVEDCVRLLWDSHGETRKAIEDLFHGSVSVQLRAKPW